METRLVYGNSQAIGITKAMGGEETHFIGQHQKSSTMHETITIEITRQYSVILMDDGF